MTRPLRGDVRGDKLRSPSEYLPRSRCLYQLAGDGRGDRDWVGQMNGTDSHRWTVIGVTVSERQWHRSIAVIHLLSLWRFFSF